MPYPLDDKLVVGISSRALFDLKAADEIYTNEGLGAYRDYQRAHEQDSLHPGTGFPLVRALLRINELTEKRLVEVIVMSRNDADSSLRIFNSAESHHLDITRGALTGGANPWPYLKPFEASLFLSAEASDVVAALKDGFPAALVLAPPLVENDEVDPGVRIAFDGDAVLFDDEAERVFQREQLAGFVRHEVEHQDTPMNPGPFRPFFLALNRLQAEFPQGESPVRTALVTSRNAPAHKRVVNTFRAWGIHTDEAFFLGGIDKTGVLEVFRPHIFFDDQLSHLQSAGARVPAARVIPTYEQPEIFAPGEVPVIKKPKLVSKKPQLVPKRSGKANTATRRLQGGSAQPRNRDAAAAPEPIAAAESPSQAEASDTGGEPVRQESGTEVTPGT